MNFTSAWTGPAGFTSNENYPVGLQPGAYSLVLTDACGAIYNGNYTLSQPTPWNVIFDANGPQCESSSDGSIDLTVSGATAPYGYNWAAVGGFSAATQDLTDLPTASYQLIITDDNGCEWTHDYNLLPSNSFSFDLGSDTTVCQEDDIVVSGPAGLTYQWQDGSNNQFYLINAEDWAIGANTVVLTATSEVGCTYSDAYIFTVEDCILVDEYAAEMVQLWPNPVVGQLNISMNVVQNNITLNLYDVSGKMVFSQSFNQTNNIQAAINLPVGIYTAEIITDQLNWSKKVLVQQ
ncbi:MAG: T9SS type A sorting domain-containing protein [Flavobacteriales bacterium]|nr:T9SS type A sorting domain-containing protein [Flavobacteriales bacterium]